MTITQTIDIPASFAPGGGRRLTIDIPREVPAGPVILTFTPADLSEQHKDRQLEAAAALAADDYRRDPKLTAFCALDGEDFYETR